MPARRSASKYEGKIAYLTRLGRIVGRGGCGEWLEAKKGLWRSNKEIVKLVNDGDERDCSNH